MVISERGRRPEPAMPGRCRRLAGAAGLAVAVLLSGCQAGPSVSPAKPTSLASRYAEVTIPAPSLRGNQIGEKDSRSIYVYLPPSYFASTARFPVIYYLPGFGDTSMLGFSLPDDADQVTRNGDVHESIIVSADGVNQLGGSFYVNSPMTGGWEDYIVKDVVHYVDSHYRSVPKASARAITGHSMGGFGAINIGMHHPDVFSVVYSISPGLFAADGLAHSQMLEKWAVAESLGLRKHLKSLPKDEALPAMFGAVDTFSLAYGLAFASNPQSAPPYQDFPVSKVRGKLVRNDAVWKRWDAGFGGIPDEVRQYKANMLRLNGLVVDYGRTDEYAWIPKGCQYFDKQLSAAGIPHEVRGFDGDHQTRLSERISSYMLPFLSQHLSAT